jgi:uncharacterized phage protein gp47/JayE
MYKENNTQEIVKDRMLDNITDDVAKDEGSFIFDAVIPVSFEVETGYEKLDEVLKLVFARTSEDEWLEMRSEEHGVIKRTGEEAITEVKFSGSVGVTIPENSLIQTESGLSYYTVEEVITNDNGEAFVNVKAEEIGVQYNVPANAITEIPVKITGIKSVTNPDIVDSGVNPETDQELLDRLLLKVRNPATSGNDNHYKQWALEVDGIGDARVKPLWAGDGTVKVIVISSDRTAVDSITLQNVRDYIESSKPIGATVSVISANTLDINIEVDVDLAEDYTLAEVESNISERIINYLQSIAFSETYASYAIIGSNILNSEGVIDYTNLLVNGGTSNVSIGDEDVAELGNVVVT